MKVKPYQMFGLYTIPSYKYNGTRIRDVKEIFVMDITNNYMIDCFNIKNFLDELEMYRILYEIGFYEMIVC